VFGLRMLAVKNSKTRLAVGASGAKRAGSVIPSPYRIPVFLITTNSCAMPWALML
jgi:hypothetical protein